MTVQTVQFNAQDLTEYQNTSLSITFVNKYQLIEDKVLSFLNEELCQSTVTQSSEMFDQIVFTAQYEHMPFIALYVAIAAFNVLFKLRYSLNIEYN